MCLNRFKKCIIVFATLTLLACGGDDVTYRMGVSTYEPTYIETGRALKSALLRNGAVMLDIIQTNGSQDSLQKLRAKKMDFALIQGGFDFDDTDLMSIAAVGTEYLHIVVPVSSDIHDLSDLAGKRVATGIEGTGSRMIVERIIEAARFEPPIRLLPSTRDSLQNQFSEGNIDAAMFVTDLRRDLRSAITGGRYRPVGVRASIALAMMLYDIEAAVIPLGVYGKNLSFPEEATPTLSVRTNLLVHENVPDSVVKSLIETLFDYHVRQRARLPELTEKDARVGVKLSLHPAAKKYYTRNDPITSDEFEIAGVLLAVFIAVLSALNFLWEWYCARPQTKKEDR